MSMAAAKRTAGAEEWWQTLPKMDGFEHSLNSGSLSMMPPCQNRGPAKDERKTVRTRPRVGGQPTPTPTTSRPSAASWPTAAGLLWCGQRGLMEPVRAASFEGCLTAGRLCECGALDRLGRSVAEVLDLLGWLRDNQVEVISLAWVH